MSLGIASRGPRGIEELRVRFIQYNGKWHMVEDEYKNKRNDLMAVTACNRSLHCVEVEIKSDTELNTIIDPDDRCDCILEDIIEWQ